MTLEDLGNIGDFVGGIGVVVTLAYLAIQVRQNTRQLAESSRLVRGNTAAMISSQIQQTNAPIIQSLDLAETMVRGAQDFGALSDGNRYRFAGSMSASMRLFETLHQHYTLGLLTEEEWSAFTVSLRRRLAFPGVEQWWRSAREEFSASFRDFVTREVLTALRTDHPSNAPEA